ncbi:MAG TPA: hypothetical protein VLE73_06850 [Candidatus Saccharimonadales bacterium]|nr:hypothetical protein [Candidatus Saccharimonadales bacterium]
MSKNTVEAPLPQLAVMTGCIEALTDVSSKDNPFIEWHYVRHPNEYDTVTALVDLVAYEHGKRRLLFVTQWLGPAAAFGDVRYSARDLEDGPLIMWRQDPKTTEDLVYWDVLQNRPLPYDTAEATRLASLLKSASPIQDASLYMRPHSLVDRVVDAYLRLPNLLAEPAHTV